MPPMFEITSYRVVEKRTTNISLKKYLTSCQKVFHAHESAESWNIVCMEEKGRSVNLITIFHIFQYVANVFHILL